MGKDRKDQEHNDRGLLTELARYVVLKEVDEEDLEPEEIRTLYEAHDLGSLFEQVEQEEGIEYEADEEVDEDDGEEDEG